MQCVVLAGGLATRLGALAATVPKLLVEVAGRPFADHQLAWLAREGVDEVVLCIAHLGDQIRAHVGDGAQHGLRVTYVDEGADLRGTGGALRLAYDDGALAKAFAVLYGDSYLPLRIGAVWADFDRRRPAALMTVFANDNRLDASNAQLRDGQVVRYEKGGHGLQHIDYGLSILDRDAVMPAVAPRGDLATTYAALARDGRLAGHEVHERFYEVGCAAGIADLEAALR